MKITFVFSHPIQYFVPLLQLMVRQGIDVRAIYCSDNNLEDVGFGRKVDWDIPLLEGYKFTFLKNFAKKKSVDNKFWGLINWGIFKEISQSDSDVFVVHGWSYFTNILAIMACKMAKKKVWMRAESPLNQELMKPKKLLLLKKILFKYIFFPKIDKFLYIGEQNKKFYQYYGVNNNKLVFTPYCVDNDRFSSQYKLIKDNKLAFKNKYNIPIDNKAILFVGKFIDKKKPLVLIKAFMQLKREDFTLILVGDGELLSDIKSIISQSNNNNIILTGFKNQSEIAELYVISDVFVLPSTIGETWGLVVNEAMNFGLPVILSDEVGSAIDLVKGNGYIFKQGNITELSNKIKLVLEDNQNYQIASKRSLSLIKNYNYQIIIDNLKKAYLSN